MAWTLFADRFLAQASGRALDLATAELAWIRPVTASDPAMLADWSARAARLLEADHPHLVPLLDFGSAGRGSHFEAWACPHPHSCWGSRDRQTADALVAVTAFVAARRVDIGRLGWSDIIDLQGRPAVLPSVVTGALRTRRSETGSPGSDASRHDDPGVCLSVRLTEMIASCGVSPPRRARTGAPTAVRPARPAGAGAVPHGSSVPAGETLERLGEVLDGGESGQPRALRLHVPDGRAGLLVCRILGRLARLRGYVPLSTRLLSGSSQPMAMVDDWCAHVGDRHLLLLHRADDPVDAERLVPFLLDLGRRTDRPHVLLYLDPAGDEHPALQACHEAWPARVPGHPRDATAGPRVTPRSGRLREEPARYAILRAVPPAVPSAAPQSPAGRRWPSTRGQAANGDPARVAVASAAARAGRHARAERLLREAIGHAARRDDHRGAGDGALVLGRLLLDRGRLAEAVDWFDRARQHFDSAGLVSASIRAAVFTGLAWTDAGRCSEAEAALRAAHVAAREAGDAHAEAMAALAIVRCLLWRGRIDEASRWLDAVRVAPSDAVASYEAPAGRGQVDCRSISVRERFDEVPRAVATEAAAASGAEVDLDLVVTQHCLGARLALTTHDLARAGRLAIGAVDRAVERGQPLDRAAACLVMARVYGRIGDVRALHRTVETGLSAARAAHAPLRALRLRIVLADGLLRGGHADRARPLLARLARLDPTRLPAVVRGALDAVLRSTGTAERRAGESSPQHIPAGTGTTQPAPAAGESSRRPEAADCIVEILGICQSEEDEERAVRRVVSTLGRRLGTALCTCVGGDGGGATSVLASEGCGVVPDRTIRRAQESGLTIAPGATLSGLEAAVPIRFGGAVVGVLAGRWAADRPPDWVRIGTIVVAAAAAVAPSVRSWIDRRNRPQAGSEATDCPLVGVSQAICGLRREIARAAPVPFSVVVEGESGSGKELVARAIHELGPRGQRRFCALNCAALADELVEAELFGHARGAFTGAIAERKGLFEEADGGTLLLDEVGELTARAQAKLLRAIQEGEVRRIGENVARPVDVRIVAATNRPLGPAVQAGAFRQDLWYRLEVIRIVVPPLRERPEDVPVLAVHFWHQATGRIGSRATLASSTLAALARYDWPGNVRELQNTIAALAVAAGRRGSIGPERLPAIIAGQAITARSSTLEEARRFFEGRFVRAALARAGGRRGDAARELGVTRQGLAKLMTRLGIEP